MSATPHDGAGTGFSFKGANFTVTNIVINNTDPATEDKIDVSHVGLTAGNSVKTIDRPLKGSVNDTGREVVIDYLGTGIIADADTGVIILTVNNVQKINAVATVASSTLTFATNDAVRGQVTFKVERY